MSGGLRTYSILGRREASTSDLIRLIIHDSSRIRACEIRARSRPFVSALSVELVVEGGNSKCSSMGTEGRIYCKRAISSARQF